MASRLQDTFIPKLESEFKLTYTIISQQHGGGFEFLKRYREIAPGYTSLTVHPEAKHVRTLFDRYSAANGKAPKLFKTPCVSSSSYSPDDSKCLSDFLSAEYRSLVDIAMYMAQERFDIQYATKTLASSLKSPTRKSWLDLGRLIGYLQFSEGFALRMNRSEKGRTFMESVLGVDGESNKNNLEVFTDSDWAGAGDMKSTSAAVHTLNGLVIFSTSRSQKCISLSPTEAEWYSASSGVCDALYLHHIVSFITDDDIDVLTSHMDNRAVKMLSLKQGGGRLRHINGRLLWIQSKVGSHELTIKQIKTLFNVADVNTKPLQRDRFLGLLYLLGFTSDGVEVGQDEFSRLQSKELVTGQVKMVSRILSEEAGMSETYQRKPSAVNALAKQVLRVLSAFSLINLTEGFQVASPTVVFDSCEVQVYTSAVPVMLTVTWMISQLRHMKDVLVIVMFFSCIHVAAGSADSSDQALSLWPLTWSPI
eukprot:s3048_g18.t1